MNEELNKALEQISDKHIHEAAHHRKPRRAWWISGIAAALALIVGWTAVWGSLGSFTPTDPTSGGAELGNRPSVVPTVEGTVPVTLPTPTSPQSPDTVQLVNLVAGPEYPEMVSCPNFKDYTNSSDYFSDYSKWEQATQEHYNQPDGYADSLADFWSRSIPEFLSGEGNRAYSPLSLYLALAMLAETTGGESRQQILDLLGAESIEELRTQASYVWNAHYCADGQTTSLLASSLWLDDSYSFNSSTVETLAGSYYASVFHGDLGTEEMDEQLRAWLNAQTGNLLQKQAQNLELDPATVFALASTVYFSADWESGFHEANTAEQVFHCKDFDLTTPFMNKTISAGTYYWGEDFGAVRLELSGGNDMWLILPDEDKSVADVLESGEYLELTQNPGSWTNKKKLRINLSMPKFDISSQTDLIEGTKNLGVTDVFDYKVSNFTPMTDTPELYVGKIDHAVRVAADEEGVIAAAYTVMMIAASGMPTLPDEEEEIDFILDRPFLFVITSRDNLPMFAGVVEQP